jgi:hypothetical protein
MGVFDYPDSDETREYSDEPMSVDSREVESRDVASFEITSPLVQGGTVVEEGPLDLRSLSEFVVKSTVDENYAPISARTRRALLRASAGPNLKSLARAFLPSSPPFDIFENLDGLSGGTASEQELSEEEGEVAPTSILDDDVLGDGALDDAMGDADGGALGDVMEAVVRRVTRNGGSSGLALVAQREESSLTIRREKQAAFKAHLEGAFRQSYVVEGDTERVFHDSMGVVNKFVPTSKITEYAPGFPDHVGRFILLFIAGVGWVKGYVERVAKIGDIAEEGDRAFEVGKHSVQLFADFHKIKRYEQATTQPAWQKLYSDYVWLAEEEKAGRLVFKDHRGLGWTDASFVPATWKRRDITTVYSPEMLAWLSAPVRPLPPALL